MILRLRFVLSFIFVTFSIAFVRAEKSLCSTDGDCKNDGRCRPFTDARGFARRRCECLPEFGGDLCQFSLCKHDNVCENGGVCAIGKNNQFACHCPLGFTGSLCEVPIATACSNKTCLNGLCRLDGSVDRAVCDCFPGFAGDQCQHVAACDATSCHGHGTCEERLPGYKCHCEAGWTGVECDTDVDECQQHQCKHGQCINSPGSYVCRCENGFAGRDCSVFANDCSTRPCQNGGRCLSKWSFHSFRPFTCSCPPGFTGDLCEKNVDDCVPPSGSPFLSRCSNGGVCVDGVNEFQCQCLPGFTGPTCEQNVNECALYGQGLCLNGGTCFDEHGSFRCFCVVGYSGERCEIPDDKCHHNLCYPGSTCVNHIHHYSCECAEDRMGQFCELENPCAVDKNPCLHGRCNADPRNNSYTCICDEGFTGPNCDIDVDECQDKNNACERGKCVNTVGGFRCQCDEGFEGALCNTMTDYCRSQPCANGATCLSSESGFRCLCMPGWTGESCEEPKAYSPACTELVCLHGGVCRKIYGGEFCHCQPSFTGTTCNEVKANPCEKVKCLNGGSPIASADYDSCSCSCLEGFAGTRCQRSVRMCSDNPCEHGHCQDTPHGFQCLCHPGYTGATCNRNIDDCVGVSCGTGHCEDRVNDYQCMCPATHTGRHCEIEVVEPCQQKPCLNNGTCTLLNLNGEYRCDCQPGFRGRHCSIDESVCIEQNCQNGGHCVRVNDNDRCQCPAGFGGFFCERNFDMCRSQQCANNGTCENLDNDFFCNCPFGFTGRRCEKWVDVEQFLPEAEKERKLCVVRNCTAKAANGVCDSECNLPGCDFDGGDCSAGVFPFQLCPYANYCKFVFADGSCNEICNNAQCNFDGGDCRRRSTQHCPADCAAGFGDDTCSPRCNTAACGWDGGDCLDPHRTSGLLEDGIVLVLHLEPKKFVATVASTFQGVLSRFLQVIVKYDRDEDDNPAVYCWHNVTGRGARIDLDADAVAVEDTCGAATHGVQVLLSVDVSVCQEGLHDLLGAPVSVQKGQNVLRHCFESTDQIVNFIGTANAKKTPLSDDLNAAVYSARVNPRRSAPSSPTSTWVGVVAFFCLLVFTVIGSITGRKKVAVIKSTWWPPSEEKRSQPVNHDYWKLQKPNQFHHMGMPLINDISGHNSAASSTRTSFHGPLYPGFPLDPPKPMTSQSQTPTHSGRLLTRLHGLAAGDQAFTLESLTPDEKKCNTTLCQQYGRTALHWLVDATGTKDEPTIISQFQTLMAIGVPVGAVDDAGDTELAIAIRRHRIQVACWLLELRDSDGTPRINVNLANDKGFTPLHEAVSATESVELVQALLARGADVNAVADNNHTALTMAARKGDSRLAIVQVLLSVEGVRPEAAGDKMHNDYTGTTPLHEAASCNSVEILKLLLARTNLNINVQDSLNRTPIFLAAESGHLETLNILLEHCRDNRDIASTPNDLDMTPLERAEEQLRLTPGPHNYAAIVERLRVFTGKPAPINYGHPEVPAPMGGMSGRMVQQIDSICPSNGIRGQKRTLGAFTPRSEQEEKRCRLNPNSVATSNGYESGYSSFQASPPTLAPPPTTSTTMPGVQMCGQFQPSPSTTYAYPMTHSQSPNTNSESYGTPSPNETVSSFDNRSTDTSARSDSSFSTTPGWQNASPETHLGSTATLVPAMPTGYEGEHGRAPVYPVPPTCYQQPPPQRTLPPSQQSFHFPSTHYDHHQFYERPHPAPMYFHHQGAMPMQMQMPVPMGMPAYDGVPGYKYPGLAQGMLPYASRHAQSMQELHRVPSYAEQPR